MKLQLPNVTLICVDCIDPYRAISVVEHCTSLCDFGSVKFLTSEIVDYPHCKIEKIGINPDHVQGLIEYSNFMLFHIHEYCDTSHMLIVQHDGWILYPEIWTDEFLNYDYTAPLFIQNTTVGSGGFSLRSKNLMETVSKITPKLENGLFGNTGYAYEDGVICFGLRHTLDRMKFKFAPIDMAIKWAYGGNESHYNPKPFGFHAFYSLNRLVGGDKTQIHRKIKPSDVKNYLNIIK